MVAVRDPDRIQRAVDLWTAANSTARALLVLDVTSSMGQPAPNGTQSRAQAMVAAARAGLDLFAVQTAGSDCGPSPVRHQQAVPIDDLSGDQRAELDGHLANLSVERDQPGRAVRHPARRATRR